MLGAVSIVEPLELEELPDWHYRKATGEFARLCVAPARQGKGMSRLLVKHVEAQMKERGIRVCHILAAVQNVPAVRCYRSLDYVFAGQVAMYGHEYFACEKLL